jgi:hypothetical protein
MIDSPDGHDLTAADKQEFNRLIKAAIRARDWQSLTTLAKFASPRQRLLDDWRIRTLMHILPGIVAATWVSLDLSVGPATAWAAVTLEFLMFTAVLVLVRRGRRALAKRKLEESICPEET